MTRFFVTPEELVVDRLILTGENANHAKVLRLKPGEEVEAIGKVRYSHKGASCKLTLLEDGRVLCRFDEPQRAMTPGQAAVFYKDDYVLCGGTIDRK